MTSCWMGMLLGMWAAASAPADGQAGVPVSLGVDDGGSYHWFGHHKLNWEQPAWYAALDELGAKLVSVHFWPVSDAGERSSELTKARLVGLDDQMRRRGLRYTLNVELSNWMPKLEITPGINEFEHPGGTHHWGIRMEWLSAVLPPERPGPPALAAITYDECEHMLLSNNKYANSPANTFDKPFLASTHGLPLLEGYNRLSEQAQRIREEHYAGRVRVQTEQVWPDLFHLFAGAGWTVTPKLLKENMAFVVMPIAMGAALQYREAGSALWASPDLWNRGAYPGHSPAALRSALLAGYWLRAEVVYVENLDFNKWSPRHPAAEKEGSLVHWTSPEEYQLTVHGRVFRDFAREYVPANPRPIRWQDYDPKVAIIRLPDGGWGQFTPAGGGELESRNRLLGNRDHPMDDPAGEWLEVWPILTHGAARRGAISYNNPLVYPQGVGQFFTPIDSVAVFDHTVGAAPLKNIECMVVCGHELSAPTFAAIRERVAAGATCIIARRLYDRHAPGELSGKWLVVDQFSDPRVAEWLRPFVGPPDVARFRFRRHVVEFRRGTGPDDITVQVSPRSELTGQAGSRPPG